jgi:peptidoglycan/xylan/chitin deacetylase (PgdA/CDA1 family)
MRLFFTFILLTSLIAKAEKSNNYSLLILNSLQTHQKASNYHSWLNSKEHPNKIIENINSNQASQFCLELDKVSTKDQVIFFNALFNSKLPCKGKIILKIENYLNVQILQSELTQFSNNNLLTWGPSKEKQIDTTGGPIYISGDLGYKEVALTFDDGPHSSLTPKLLKILKDENVQVTFFSVGKNIKANPHIIEKIIYDDHSLGNHSWNHPDMKRISKQSSIDQITSTFEQINHQNSFFIPFFRYPYGSYTKKLKKYLKTNDVSAFFWNVDTLDWKYKDPVFLIDYAWGELQKTQGGIVLFHDVQPQTIAILPAFIKRLKSAGYTPVVFKAQHERL